MVAAASKASVSRKKGKPKKAAGKGRPSTYNPDRHPELARCLALGGHTDVEIAKILGVTERTLNRWKNSHPDFCQSLKGGKEPVDKSVENELLHNCRSEQWIEVESRYIVVKGKKKLVSVKEIPKRRLGNVTAQIFWLKNRKPKEWRDAQQHDVDLTAIVTHTRADEARKKIAALASGKGVKGKKKGKAA